METFVVTSFTFTRAGTLHADAERKLSQAVAESFSTVAPGTTIVALCDEDGSTTRRFVSAGDNAKNRAYRVANSLNASSGQDDKPASLMRADLRRLAWHPGTSSVENETQAGTALQAVAESIDGNLLPGDWVAISLRAPSRAERSAWHRWFSHQKDTRTHHSMRAASKLVSIWAGSDTGGRAEQLVHQLTAALGGFDVIAPAEPVTRASLMRPWTAATGISILAAAASWFGAPYLAEIPELQAQLQLPSQWPLVPAFVAGCITATTIAKSRGFIPSAWTRVQRTLESGLVPAPPRRHLPAKAPQKATTRWVGDGDERRQVDVPATDGDWPLAQSAFMVGPELIASLALPGTASTGSTASRRVPASLQAPIGPEVGDSDGTTAYLSRDDMWAGLLVLGDPGSGKSKLLEWIVGEAMAHQGHTSQAGIIFDTKRDGRLSRDLDQWARWATDRTGQRVNLRTIRLADPAVPIKLDIFGRDGTLRQRAERIIDAMRYVEGDGIGARSKETLQAILPLAMLCNQDIATLVPGVDPNGSVFHFARVLAGGLGDQLAVDLAAAIEAQSDHPDRARVVAEAGILFGGTVTPATRRTQSESTRNKLESMASIEPFWRAGEQPGVPTWDRLFGTGRARGEWVSFDFSDLSQEVSNDVASFLIFTLRDGMMRHARGFQDQGRIIHIVADEVKAIAADNADLVKWFRSDGRSFGARPAFASQYLEDLPPMLQDSVLGFATKAVFKSASSKVATRVALELSTGGAEFTKDDVQLLPRFSAIIATEAGQERQPAFTVQVPNFEDRHLG